MSIRRHETLRDGIDAGVTRRGFIGSIVAAGTLGTGRSINAAVRRPAQAASSGGTSNAAALLGGTPVRRTPFPSWPIANAKEEDALVRVIRSGRWNRGENVTAFERRGRDPHRR
jgi:hypothetical protein